MLVLENAFNDWMQVAQRTGTNDELFVSSPYLTGDLIESIFDSSPSDNKFLVTELKLQNVITGSLDLQILNNLLSSGVKIFHVRSLHAKALATSDNLLVGSQNFTTAGLNNSELTSLSADKEAIKFALEWFTKQIGNGSPVTKTVLRRFEKFLEKVPEQGVMEEILKILVEQDKNFDRWLQSHFALRHSKKSNVRQIGRARRVCQHEQMDELGDPQYVTFKRKSANLDLNSFYDVHGSGSKIDLKHHQRYLLINKTNDALYFAPANIQQIGKFADGVRRTDIQKIIDLTDELRHLVNSVSVNLSNPAETEDHHNLAIRCDLKGDKWSTTVETRYFFDGIRFRAIGKPAQLTEQFKLQGDRTDVLNAINDWLANIESYLPNLVFTPFQYKNSRLGKAPHRLFSKYEMNLSLGAFSLGSIDDHYFYVLE